MFLRAKRKAEKQKSTTFLQGFFILFGSSTWARTRDTRINSPLLYRLSYRGIGSTSEGVIILACGLLVNNIARKYALYLQLNLPAFFKRFSLGLFLFGQAPLADFACWWQS